jgi:fluoride exporter
MTYLLVFLGGGLGSLARYTVSLGVTQRWGVAFPMGTLVVNISGSFLIGLLMALLSERLVHPYWRFFLVAGVLGGYTTFSTFEYETLQAARAGQRWVALWNVVGSVGAGYLAVWLGMALGSRR